MERHHQRCNMSILQFPMRRECNILEMRRLLNGLSQKFRINGQQYARRLMYPGSLIARSSGKQIDRAGLVDRGATSTFGSPLGAHRFADQEIEEMGRVLVLGDIAAWHIAVVFKRHSVPPGVLAGQG